MASPTNHISKNQLIEFINTNLYVDDMITIDRHLETCDKCKKQYERLLNSSGSSPQLLLSKYKYFIAGVLLIITAVAGYLLKDNLPKVNFPKKTEHLEKTEPIIRELPLSTDTINSEAEKDSSVVNSQLETSPLTTTNTSQEVQDTPISYTEPNISTPQQEEAIIIEDTNNQNSQISSEAQSAPQQTVNTESNVSPNQTESEENSGNLGFKVNPTKKQSASPVIGYTSYNKYLTKSIDQLILPINGIEESSLVISFDVQEDKSLSNFKIKSNTSDIYAESMIDVIKDGPKWQPYHSQEDSTIIINRAEISIVMTN